MTIRKPKNRGSIKPPVGYGVDWSDPINGGLNGCWLLNEGGGNKLFDLARLNHGSFINAPTWQPGNFGAALSFNGTTQAVNMGTSSALNAVSGVKALSFWFKINSFVSTTAYALAGNGYNGTNTGFSVGFNTGGAPPASNGDRLCVETYNGTIHGAYTSKTWSSADNKWTHCFVMFDGSAFRIFVNGVEDTNAEGTQIGTVTTTAKFYIGAQDINGTDGRWFPGLLDCVRFQARSFTRSEITRLYRDPIAGILIPKRRLWNGAPAAVGGTVLSRYYYDQHIARAA